MLLHSASLRLEREATDGGSEWTGGRNIMKLPGGVRRPAVLGGALLAMMSAVACTGEADQRPDPTTPPSAQAVAVPEQEATTPAVTAAMQRYLETADEANARKPDSVVVAGARPAVFEGGAGIPPPVVRDEGSGDSWNAGTYRLVVHCAGAGTLQANFTLGDTTERAEMRACSPGGSTREVVLRLRADAAKSSVIIVPSGRVNAAVSYQIRRG